MGSRRGAAASHDGLRHHASSGWKIVQRLAPDSCAIQKWPFHWSMWSELRVPVAPTKSEGHERENAWSERVRCSQSCEK